MLHRISSTELTEWRAYFDLLEEEAREAAEMSARAQQMQDMPKPKPKVIPLD